MVSAVRGKRDEQRTRYSEDRTVFERDVDKKEKKKRKKNSQPDYLPKNPLSNINTELYIFNERQVYVS